MSIPAEDQPSADAVLTNYSYRDDTETNARGNIPVLRLLCFVLDLRAFGKINVGKKLL